MDRRGFIGSVGALVGLLFGIRPNRGLANGQHRCRSVMDEGHTHVSEPRHRGMFVQVYDGYAVYIEDTLTGQIQLVNGPANIFLEPHHRIVRNIAGRQFVELNKRRKFVFKIKTKSGSIVGNIVIEGTSQSNAESKLRRRYPGCEILDCQER